MKMVLRDDSGFFKCMGNDRYGNNGPIDTTDLDKAQVFDVAFACGKLIVNPEMPDEGRYEPMAVTLNGNQ